MTPKTWKSCLGVLCLLAAGTANAAKISFSEKGFIDVGALVQGQYRIEQDAAGSGSDPSNDFLLRRARILVSGQYNDHIGFIMSTEISYGAVGGAGGGTLSGAGANFATGSGTSGAGFNNNIYLLDALATYKVSKELIFDAGLMLLPYSHNSMNGAGKYASINNFPMFQAPGASRGGRDVGLEVRGLLLDDRLYYRIGVFNGVQTVATTGTGAATVRGINPGDAPKVAGMIRWNFAGKEEGYSFCQVCFSATPVINLGVSAEFQANAFRGSAPQGPTTAPVSTGMGSYTEANVDLLFDFPFPGDIELSVDVLGSKVWAGYQTPQSGWGVFGLVSIRFGPIGPFGQIEYFNSQAKYVGFTRVGAPGTAVTSFVAGDLKTYRGGLTWYLDKHNYKISGEIAFQDRENEGTATTIPPATTPIGTVPKNHWVGTLQVQANF